MLLLLFLLLVLSLLPLLMNMVPLERCAQQGLLLDSRRSKK